MVKNQIERRGIKNSNILKAMYSVPRHIFVPEKWENHSYYDKPVLIGHGQTISQPYIVAFMCELAKIKKSDRILEIGTGSGYGAAVLSHLVKEVYTIEIIPELAKEARKRLDNLGYKNVFVRMGDGYQGWKEYAPYDAIIITAAISQIPQPLLEQLKIGGYIIMPLLDDFREDLVRVKKTKTGQDIESFGPVQFVPFQRHQ